MQLLLLSSRRKTTDFGSTEYNLELQSLQFMAFLYSVCHVIIFVQDWFVDPNLVSLKKRDEVYVPKKVKILMPEQVAESLSTAPDYDHLLTKVIVVIGLLGTLRKQDLWNLEDKDVQDDPQKRELLFSLETTKNCQPKNFLVDAEYSLLVKKYMTLQG